MKVDRTVGLPGCDSEALPFFRGGARRDDGTVTSTEDRAGVTPRDLVGLRARATYDGRSAWEGVHVAYC